MILLALDTCLGACSAAIVEAARVVASVSEPMTRGHQERLAPMARDLMINAGVTFASLDRIGVTIGPGSFTGLRVGLAFAKGLALALDRPCVGVGTLEALAASVEAAGRHVAVIDAGRGHVYLQIFEAGHALAAPDILPLEIAAARLIEIGEGLTLVGPNATALARHLPHEQAIDLAAPDIAAVAALATRAAEAPARPLYLRPPDAKPKAR